MDALIAEPERVADLAKRRAVRVKPADRVLVVDARELGVVLQLEQAISGRARITQETTVHRLPR